MNSVIKLRSIVIVVAVGSSIAVTGFGLFLFRERLSLGFNSSQEVESKLQVPKPTTPKIRQTKTVMPRSLKLKLTLDTPADLKVKQSDIVAQGQVLSDRASVRKVLMEQQRSLLIQLGRLKAHGAISDRPMPSFAVEQAKVDGARLRVTQAKRAIADFWAHLPYTHTAWNLLALPNERVKLASLEAQLSQAEVDLKLAVAQLQTAKEEHQLSVDKTQHQRDSVREREQVLARLQVVEGKLARVEVRSPYAGTIKRIKWLGQANQELLVELTLAVSESHLWEYRVESWHDGVGEI